MRRTHGLSKVDPRGLSVDKAAAETVWVQNAAAGAGVVHVDGFSGDVEIVMHAGYDAFIAAVNAVITEDAIAVLLPAMAAAGLTISET